MLRQPPDATTDAWAERLRTAAIDKIPAAGVHGLSVCVHDGSVRAANLRLVTLDPPFAAAVSVWVQQSYGPEIREIATVLSRTSAAVHGYLVTESVPLPLRTPKMTRDQQVSPTLRCCAGPPTCHSIAGASSGRACTRRMRSTYSRRSGMNRIWWCGPLPRSTRDLGHRIRAVPDLRSHRSAGLVWRLRSTTAERARDSDARQRQSLWRRYQHRHGRDQ